MSFLNLEYQKEFNKNFYEQELLNLRVTVVLFEHNINLILDKVDSKYPNTGFLVPGTYFPDLSICPKMHSFYNDVYGMYSKSFKVNSWYENAYVSYRIWSDGLKYARNLGVGKWPNHEVLRISLLKTKYNLPSGELYLKETNSVVKPMFLMEINSNSLNQLYPSAGLLKSYESYLTPDSSFNKNDLNIPREQILDFGRPLLISNYILCSVILAISFLSFLFVYRNKSGKAINAFGTNFYYTVLLAQILATVTILLLSSDKNSSVICHVLSYLIIICVSVYLSAVIFKTNKMMRKNYNPSLLKVKHRVILENDIYIAILIIFRFIYLVTTNYNYYIQ